MGVEQQTITREQLIDVITAWEIEAQRNPPDHTYNTPEAKAEYLWQQLMEARR
jgi:hypothetical protein